MKFLRKNKIVLTTVSIVIVILCTAVFGKFAEGARSLTSMSASRSAKDRYDLTKSRMPLVYHIANTLGSYKNLRILIGLPLTFETLSIVDAIRPYFEVVVIPQSSGPSSSTQSGVFEYLDKWGIQYFTEATEESRIQALSTYPDIVVDCSYMLGEVAMKHNLLKDNAIFIEDTKTGENRMLELQAQYGVPSRFIVLDNSYYKRLYENSTGIGYSVAGALVSMGFFMPRYTVGVVGYGYVGSGLAKYLRDLGAKDVFVTELNKNRANLAKKNRFKTVSIQELLTQCDIVITATGQPDVITRKDIEGLSKRIILANAGGEDEWIRDKLFFQSPSIKIHEDIKKYTVGTCEVWELGEGNSLNLVREISVTEYLDITFSQLVFGLFNLDRVKPAGKTDVTAFETKEFKKIVQSIYGSPTGIYKDEMR